MLNFFLSLSRRRLQFWDDFSSRRGRSWLAVVLLWLAAGVGAAGAAEPIVLGGAWRFAIDPGQAGEENGWHQPGLVVRDWTEVQIPHSWTVDPHFPYVGAAWYRRTFSVPADAAGQHARVAFERVFYRSKVWINGQLAGEHVGGYTPFEVDATAWLRRGGENTIAVQVDNAWSTETLPGARIGLKPQEQVYPWREYGGILGAVRLLLTAPVFVANLRVIADPNLSDGTGTVALTAYVRNATDRPAKVRVGFTVERDQRPVEAWPRNAALAVEATLPPRAVTPVQTQIQLRPDQVRRWGVDHPELYTARTALLEDGREIEAGTATFGIRKIEARAGKLLLNGEPIRMGGGNRHSDHPQFGSIDSAEVVEADLRQMKRANLELMRITHYPVAPRILEWADRHGLLIIEEGLNWQITEAQMDSPALRANFQSQMREMIERDWNHYVVGASVWTYNDYRSRYPTGTDARGYRQWGVVDAERREKPTYALLAAEYSPALIREVRVAAGGSTVSATIHARADFPSYPLLNYAVRVELLDATGGVIGTSRTALPVRRPGETFALDARMTPRATAKPVRARIDVVRPTSFVTAATEVAVP